MSLSSTLYTGISGLQSNAEAMSVTGNNISNSNTTGFKSSSTIFSDVLASTIASADGSSQVGRGSQISTVRTSFSQGSFQSTSSATDLAVEGDGFFMVSAESSDEVLYTRNGAFSFDSDGYLTTAEGYRVQGKSIEDGVVSGGDPTDIQIDVTSQIAANATDEIILTTNLDAGSTAIATGFDPADPDTSSNYSTSTQIYDSLGESHIATTYFTKTADNTWEWSLTVDSSELATPGADAISVVGSGTLTFDSEGNPLTGATGSSTAGELDWLTGAATSGQIDLVFDTTQYSSSSVVISQEQNGYAPGEVVDISIANDGTVTASYSNGENIDYAMLTLATFTNASGLTQEGGSLYSESANSGSPSVGTPSASQGTIYTSSLELSNVDLAQEFVDLITIQNGYSASSKVITTTDEMLQELINLKR